MTSFLTITDCSRLQKSEKCIIILTAGRVYPGKMLNYKYEGFDKIPEAFDVMDKKPKDLIKSGVFIHWD